MSVIDEAKCENCRLWVPYNSIHAFEGECTLVLGERSPIRLQAITNFEAVDPTLITPFDWFCKGFEQKASSDDSNQSAAG